MNLEVCTALVTPFTNNNKIDYVGLKNLLDHQIKANVKAILILGTTGESPTISLKERAEIISFTKKHLPSDTLLIVGAGANDTQKSLSLCKQAALLGADAVLIVTPYYNKCTQKGAYLHYKYLNDNINIPIIIYNVPSRTGFNLSIDTLCKLSKLKNIVGLKEANTDIGHVLSVFNKFNKSIYCGNDDLNFIFKKLKANGTISVTSNAYPNLVKTIWENDERDLTLQNTLFEFNKLMFAETNPIPIKYTLSKLGLIKNNLRLPLTKLSTKYKTKINNQIKVLENISENK